MNLFSNRFSNSPIKRELENMERLMEGFFSELSPSVRSFSINKPSFSPNCDIEEYDQYFLAEFDLPGFKPEDLTVEVRDNNLLISGKRTKEVNIKSESHLRRSERTHGAFSRSFMLPVDVNSDEVIANFENGVLKLYIPKMEASRPKKIQIQTGKPGVFDKLLERKEEAVLKEKKVS